MRLIAALKGKTDLFRRAVRADVVVVAVPADDGKAGVERVFDRRRSGDSRQPAPPDAARWRTPKNSP